jgi:hypothetical protein
MVSTEPIISGIFYPIISSWVDTCIIEYAFEFVDGLKGFTNERNLETVDSSKSTLIRNVQDTHSDQKLSPTDWNPQPAAVTAST